MIYIFNEECLEFLREIPSNSIDGACTDPPYGLGFMNSKWDKDLPPIDVWVELLRVLKPGAHAVICSHSRKYHRLMCNVEDAGFEVRDCLMWLYGSGFPKSHNVALGIDKHLGHGNRGRAIPTASSYQASDEEQENKLTSNPVDDYTARTPDAEPWEGWGTALKPAYEPIGLVRKPLNGSVAVNVLEHGTGGLNIDACRIGTASGRWPANVVHDGSDEVLTGFPQTQSGYMENVRERGGGYNFNGPPSPNINIGGGQINVTYADKGSAARFFYCAKASKKEREFGLETFVPSTVGDGRKKSIDNAYQRGQTQRKNTHPTVKPIALGRWLLRLITPPGGVIIDPYVGSGSFACAAACEGIDFIGIDREQYYCEIAEARSKYWLKKTSIDILRRARTHHGLRIFDLQHEDPCELSEQAQSDDSRIAEYKQDLIRKGF